MAPDFEECCLTSLSRKDRREAVEGYCFESNERKKKSYSKDIKEILEFLCFSSIFFIARCEDALVVKVIGISNVAALLVMQSIAIVELVFFS